MNLIQCPEIYTPGFTAGKHPTVFLAGGITSCPVWQDEAVKLFEGTDVTLFNPRRKEWNDKITIREQIEWEFEHLNKAQIVMFWFPCETLCPITLLEYGKMLAKGKRMVVGIHPEYKRKDDIEIQTRLEEKTRLGNHVSFFYTLEETVNHLKLILGV